MKTKAIAGVAMLSIMLASFVVLAFVQPAFASPLNSRDRAFVGGTTPARMHDRNRSPPARVNLTVGQAISLSGLQGRYVNADNKSVRGSASGSFTLTVTGVYREGYTLKISSGTFTVGDTSYKVSGGTVLMGPNGRDLSGSGTAGQGVQFLIHARIGSDSAGTARSMALLDVTNGSTEYIVRLRTPSS